MKKKIALLLVLASILCLTAGCGNTDVAPESTGAPLPSYNYPKINDPVSWEKINSFPIKSADMTEDELRQLCVDFFLYSKTALWTPDQNVSYVKTKDGDTEEVLAGTVYGGLPYITQASGNIYRLMDFVDEETGVVNMDEYGENPKFFGNQCSIGAYWGWGRVINSAGFDSTNDMVYSRGFLRVGPYTYDNNLMHFAEGPFSTVSIIEQNGPEIMYRSYAEMKLADGLVNFTTGGHTMMCTGAPVVVYDTNGVINPVESYLIITDQHSAWSEATGDQGDKYLYKNFVQKKFTFLQLLEDGYIPFTFGEFLGTDPIEETECSFSHQADTVTPSQLRAGEVKANYGISDAYAIIRDGDGNQVFKCAARAPRAATMSLNFYKTLPRDEFDTYATGEHTVEIICQLATGERLSIYTGTLVK